MVLISGNYKSALLQTNDERGRAQGVTVLQNSHQQGNKSIESGRSQNTLNTGLTRGMLTTDEFKFGFPSEGLSTTSNKWWGSIDRDKSSCTNQDGANSLVEDERTEEADKVACETGNTENSKLPQGSSLLRAVRKGAVEEGRETLKLGFFRGYSANKLGKREKVLLHQIFRSSFPRSWINDL